MTLIVLTIPIFVVVAALLMAYDIWTRENEYWDALSEQAQAVCAPRTPNQAFPEANDPIHNSGGLL